MNDQLFTVGELLRECVNGAERVVVLCKAKQVLIRRQEFPKAAQFRDEEHKIYRLIESAGEELAPREP